MSEQIIIRDDKLLVDSYNNISNLPNLLQYNCITDMLFKNCNLVKIPQIPFNSLQVLRFDNCNTKMVKVPLLMPNLIMLTIWNCSILEIPFLNGLNSLSFIALENCPNIININPNNLKNIQVLFIKNCNGITEIPLIINLKQLIIENLQNCKNINISKNCELTIKDKIKNKYNIIKH